MNEKKIYRVLKISHRKGCFISSLFMVYFSVVSKWFWSYVYHFRAINCPKLFPYISFKSFQKVLLNSELTKIQREYIQLIIGRRNSSISKIYCLFLYLKKSRSRVPLLIWIIDSTAKLTTSSRRQAKCKIKKCESLNLNNRSLGLSLGLRNFELS